MFDPIEFLAKRPRPDLLANGGFTADATWTKGTGWAIGSGVATHTAGTGSGLDQAATFVTGKRYRVTLTVSARTAGTLTPSIIGGTTVSGTAISTNVPVTEDLLAVAGNTSLSLICSSDFDGSVDNVSLRRVG